MILSSVQELSSLLLQNMPHVLLLSGQDAFSIEEGYELIKRACNGFVTIKVQEAAKLDELLGAPSLFGEKRLIAIDGVDSFKEKELKPLLHYLARPDPLIVLVLLAESIKTSSELYKVLEKTATIVQLPKVSPWDKEAKMQGWIVQHLKTRGVKIVPVAAFKLAQGVTGGYSHLVQELEKLISYIGSKNEITEADLEAISSIDAQSSLWQFSDALFEVQGQLLTMLASLQRQEVHSFVLVRHLRNVLQQSLQIASYVSSGYPDAKINEQFPTLKGKHFEKIRARAVALGLVRLGKALVLVDDLQAHLKDGPADDQTLLQTVVVRIRHALHTS